MILDVAQTMLGLLVVGLYTWALRAHFRSKSVPLGTMLISATVSLTTLAYLALTWTTESPFPVALLGLVGEALSLWLFLATLKASRDARLRLAFDRELPDSLVQHGPYRFVRHPFYTSYLLFWSSWALAIWSVWAVPFLVALFVIYVVAARGEEEKFSRSDLSGSYAAYRAKVGFLFPRLMA